MLHIQDNFPLRQFPEHGFFSRERNNVLLLKTILLLKGGKVIRSRFNFDRSILDEKEVDQKRKTQRRRKPTEKKNEENQII